MSVGSRRLISAPTLNGSSEPIKMFAAMETPDQVPAARGDRRRRIGEACASDTYNLAEFAVPGLPPK